MKVLVLSDLHLEFGDSLSVPEGLEYDVVVLAGDINAPGHRAVHWAKRDSTFCGRPVVYVAGNHELYGCVLVNELAKMRKSAEGSNVHFLNRDSIVIEGTRFLGCTLWTDFQLPVGSDDGRQEVDVTAALNEANRCLNDFRLIETSTPVKRGHRERSVRRLLQAEDTLSMHWIDRDWLRRQLAEPFAGSTVVVTHHAPASGSVAMQYATSWLTPAFVSDLPETFFRAPVLWVHGHTHSPFDYVHGACRVVSNPRGYRLDDEEFENQSFTAGYVVVV